MDLDLLKTFLAVSQTQHFGRAADRLFITQSAVSARIRLLESQLGHTLFLRNKKNVALTQEGHLFIEHANKMLAQWQQARESLKQINLNPPQLNITCPPLIWQTGINRIVSKLPNIGNLFSCNAIQPAQMNTHSHALIIEPNSLATHHQQVLADINLLAFCAQPFCTKEKLQYIHLPWSNKFNQFAEKQGLLQQNTPQTDQLTIALQLLANTASFTYLPVTFQVQSEHLNLIELNKKPPFTLSLMAYFTAASHLEANYQAAFSYIQQELNSCQKQ